MARLFLFFGTLGKFDHPFVMAIAAPVGRDKVPLDYLEPKNSHETPDLDQEDYPQYPADTDPHVVFPDEDAADSIDSSYRESAGRTAREFEKKKEKKKRR